MNWLKSLIVAGTLQALAITAAAAGANLDQIKAAGVLKIGTEGTYAPFTYRCVERTCRLRCRDRQGGRGKAWGQGRVS